MVFIREYQKDWVSISHEELKSIVLEGRHNKGEGLQLLISSETMTFSILFGSLIHL